MRTMMARSGSKVTSGPTVRLCHKGLWAVAWLGLFGLAIAACSSSKAPGPPPTCGAGERYTVITSTGICNSPSSNNPDGTQHDGSGRVHDNTTGLTWLGQEYDQQGNEVAFGDAEAYCANLGMRLPTMTEVQAISGTACAACAWPCGWTTWTSTAGAAGKTWGVDSSGSTYQYDTDGMFIAVLCVK